MYLRKGQLPILLVNTIYLAFAIFFYLSRQNYEFVLYVGVILFLFVVILLTNRKVKYPNTILWGLTLWGLMHMLGGGYRLANGDVLYNLILVPLSKTYPIFRYDQLVHIIGFGVATLVMFLLVKPLLQKRAKMGTSIFIVTLMAGFGVGALNEMIEFIATILVPETNVGGFINTSLDLVSDFIGALLATIYIVSIRKGKFIAS